MLLPESFSTVAVHQPSPVSLMTSKASGAFAAKLSWHPTFGVNREVTERVKWDGFYSSGQAKRKSGLETLID
jgi:hypothetical protein